MKNKIDVEKLLGELLEVGKEIDKKFIAAQGVSDYFEGYTSGINRSIAILQNMIGE